MTAEIKADFIVTGDAQISLEDMQRESGLVADEFWHIGDQIGRTLRRRDDNALLISSGKHKGSGLSECLNLLIDKLATQWESLRVLTALSGVEAQLAIVVYVYDVVPALDLGHDVVRRMADLRADIDIDLILLSGRDELPDE